MQMVQAWIFGAIALVAILASAKAHDQLFGIHIGLVAIIALVGMLWRLKTMDVSAKTIPFREKPAGYMDDVVRAGVIATVFWGISGFSSRFSGRFAPDSSTTSTGPPCAS